MLKERLLLTEVEIVIISQLIISVIVLITDLVI